MSAGNYLATVSDQIGCTRDSLINLIEPDPIDFASITIKPTECSDKNPGKIIVAGGGGNGDYTYILRPLIKINKHGVFDGLDEGTYTITVKDYKGCEKDTVLQVLGPSTLMSLDIEKQDLGCYGTGTDGWAKAIVYNGTPPYSYTWSTVPIQTTETAINLYFGRYVLEVVDAKGCKQRDTVIINPGECCEEVFIPNAFTPNGDGHNDEFKVMTSAGIQLVQFAVYDRWGKKVWYTNDFRRTWDGRIDGRLCDGNTFHYIFSYRCLTDGKLYVKKGDVIIVH